MPKQKFHINRFEGGLNTDFAPEDIPDNSFIQALGISVSKIGRVTVSGDVHAASGITAKEVSGDSTVNNFAESAGYGMFAFSSDYAANNTEAATNYLCINNGSYVSVWDGSNWVSFDGTVNFIDMGENSTGMITHNSYYAPNGDLRVCDGNFASDDNDENTPKWFGYTKKKTYGTGTGDAEVGGWNVQDASIESGYPKDSSGLATNSWFGAGTADQVGSYLDETREWGFHCAFVENGSSGDASALFSDATWQPNADVSYKFYTSYIYDNGQEGNPTPMSLHPTLASNATVNGGSVTGSAIAPTNEIRFMDKVNSKQFFATVDGDATNFHVGTYDTKLNAQGASNTNGNTAHGISSGSTIYIAGTNNYNGYHTVSSSNNNDNNFQIDTAQDSSLQGGYASMVGTNQAIYMTPIVKFNGDATTNFCFGATAIGAATGGNQRIIGTRMYWSSSEEGHANLWVIMEVNFEKGLKAYGIGKDEPTVTGYMPMVAQSSNGGMTVDWDANNLSYNVWKHPPKYETYESLNGYAHDSKLDAKWKTAVIANGRAYIGNVKRREKATFNVNDTALTSGKQAWNGGSAANITKDPTFGDRILKSPVDRFDTFPEEMAIELFGGDDGDQIVKLETFADRLLVFKKYTLHIINIAKDVEILESSHPGMGLSEARPCQSCLTSTGVAWINSGGAYHYNGQNIESLTDNKIEALWKGQAKSGDNTSFVKFWMSHANDVPSIGYDYDSNKLIIHKTAAYDGSDLEVVLIYDMNLKAWTRLRDGNLNNDSVRSNMVNYNNMLIYHEELADSNDPIYRYNDSPSNLPTIAENFSIYTKPYDFGTPLQRKKIYKVYITYRCNGETNINVQYYTNGNKLSLYNFTTGASNPFLADDGIDADDHTSSIMELDNTSGVWETAALKPLTSDEANKIKSFGLFIGNKTAEAVDANFEINDITIIYRNKGIK